MTLDAKKIAPCRPTTTTLAAARAQRSAIAIRSGVRAGITEIGFPALDGSR